MVHVRKLLLCISQTHVGGKMQIDTGTLEFHNPKLERSVGLTAADRKWMDDILTDVNDTWVGADLLQPSGMQQ